jgi:16S rRNA pseudouridine516 synthase
MFIALDNEVKYLKRIAIGNIELDDSLQIGEYRYLSDAEVGLLKSGL